MGEKVFTKYQGFVIAVLVFLQFTVILDFMILSPLGAILMPALNLTPAQFGLVVSGYAFSAGASGLIASGFADRFDRKKLLLFFYAGFVLGTAFCALAQNYVFLLIARIVTGLFGGVIGSIVFAITTDLFPLSMRGRVMGYVQTAFAASQVMGIPLGLYISSQWGWHAPFWMIVGVSSIVGIIIVVYLKPIDEHLKLQHKESPIARLLRTISDPNHLRAFATIALLSTGGFMLMPFSSAFSVHNLGISVDILPVVYMVTGISSMFVGPLLGKAADIYGKYKIFLLGSMLTMAMVLIYTHLGITPLHIVILVNVLLFVGITSRIISSQALLSAIPNPANRGSFMSVSSSIQQVSGGFAAMLAGAIVVEGKDGVLEHFDTLGYCVIGATLFTMAMMYSIQRLVPEVSAPSPTKN